MKTLFVVRYPKVSAFIEQKEVSDDFLPPYNPDEIYATTWEEAHEFLVNKALQQLEEVSKNFNKAVDHLRDVQALKNTTPP